MNVVTGCSGRCIGWVGECILDKCHSLYVNAHYKDEYRGLNSILGGCLFVFVGFFYLYILTTPPSYHLIISKQFFSKL